MSHDSGTDPTPDETTLPDGMGVSSERVGPTGPGQVGADGERDTRVIETAPGEGPPEQSSGGPETNPEAPAPRGD
ncbi:MAG: hypothetical protein ACXVEC_09360 [Nocardioides sp.]